MEIYNWKEIEEKLREEEYKNYQSQIRKEISDLKIIKEFSWPEEFYNKCLQILNEQLEKIENKIEDEGKSKQLKIAQSKLKQIRNSLSKLTIKKELEIFKGNIINKINKLLTENEDVILKKTPIIEQEIKDLQIISKEKIITLGGNDLIWGNPISSFKLNNDSFIIKLYKNMLYYATCNEIVQKIINSKDNKDRMRYGAQMEKLGLKALLKYINSFENEALSSENRRIIKSMFRAPLMLKLWNDEIDQVSVKNFIQNLNERKKRCKISNDEYEYTYKIASNYSLTTKIIQPKFEPQDIIYLFFQYSENEIFTAGPIFEGLDLPNMKMDNIYKEVLDNVNNKQLNNMCDISIISAQIMYREFMKKYEEKLPDKYSNLLKFFEKEKKGMKTQEIKQIDAIINGMKLAKYFDEIIKVEKESPEKSIDFEDMVIFKKGNEKRIEVESLLLKQINPSFKFYIIKNLQLIKTLINTKLSNEEINEICNKNSNEIPFWVFLIRNMSSLNYINYENKNNPFSNDISNKIRDRIEDLIKEGKENQLDNGWLNLIINEVPNEILMPNIHLFYSFFNNLFEKLNITGKCKEQIENILNEFYFDLIDCEFEGKLKNLLSEDIRSSKNNILQLVFKPKTYIYKKLCNDFSNETKNIFKYNNFKDLETNLNTFIDKIPEYIQKINDEVTKIESIYEEEEYNKQTKKFIEKLEEKISKYNLLCENLKKPTNNIALDIQIHPKEITNYLDGQKSFKEDIKSYKNFLIKEETFIYWEIPFKKEKGKIITYNKDIQIFRGNYDKLYFIIEEINDEFKNNFSMNIKEIEKSGNKTEENNEIKEFKDYISFDEVKIFRLDKNDNTFIVLFKIKN